MIGGGRVPKRGVTMRAVGALDEVNAFLGWARVCSADPEVVKMIGWIQQRLFCVGAEIASPPDRSSVNPIGEEDIRRLEKSMDELDEVLEPLRNFILPGGCESASRLHVARAVCRRAERDLWDWVAETGRRKEPAVFINRLADWLFIAARAENAQAAAPEVIWKEER
jgi:cob(I)alamin adenosyltransferase